MKLLPLLDRFFRINKGYGDINQLQLDLMKLVDHWVRTKKTPVPHIFLIKEIGKTKHADKEAARKAIKALLFKGYVRRAIVTSNKVFYVQLRSIKI